MRRFIFLWFLAVGLISLIGAVWIGRSTKLTAAGFYESEFVSYTAETVAHALDNGGVSALHDIENRIDPKRKLRFFVFDAGLNEVSGGPAPESVSALASRLRPEDNAQFEILGGELLAGSIVTAHDGRVY